MLDLLSSAGNLALVIIAFGLIIVLHELGHFLAAKWAGVRVHTFAVGFGPPICSWRKGIGFRMGSTWPDVKARLLAESGETPPGGDKAPILPPHIGETEYRLAWIPLGGYVEMLGQEDLKPGATSADPRSFAAKHPWKRLMIISAGVVMNIITAAALFIVVFMAGLHVPPPVIGATGPGSPAATTTPVNAVEANVEEVGLQPGDRIVEIAGRKPNSFNDLFASSAMAEPNEPIRLLVDRPGIAETLQFSIVPRKGEASGLLELGVGAPLTTRLADPPAASASEQEKRAAQQSLELMGLAPLGWGGVITHVDGQPVQRLAEVRNAFSASDGQPLTIRGVRADNEEITFEVTPQAGLQTLALTIDEGVVVDINHILGLTPPMRITDVTDQAKPYGLQPGDVVARVGRRDWPNPGEAMRIIRAAAGSELQMLVLRSDELVTIDARVGGDGRIGFNFRQALDTTIVTRAPEPRTPTDAQANEDEQATSTFSDAAERISLLPGSRLVTIDGAPVESYDDIRSALRTATADARAEDSSRKEDAVSLRLRLPLATSEQPVTEEIAWTLRSDEIEAIHALGWDMPFSPLAFQQEEITLKADTPVGAIGMGLAETRRVMIMTYLTIARLFQGSVRVEHLNGPVGIAHIGTRVVDQGFIKLLFFMAVVSVNLAVLNFLPLPIVDGGHAIFIGWEWATGRPVSVAVQNVATLVGLLLIGAVFVIVTYHDVMALLS